MRTARHVSQGRLRHDLDAFLVGSLLAYSRGMSKAL